MKQSEKIQKIFSARGWRSAAQSVHRVLHPVSYEAVKARIDLAGLERIRARHGIAGEEVRYQKYLEVDRFLPVNIRRAHDLGLSGSPPLKVLDLGSGAGYFLHVCRYLGHTGLGLDMDEPAMYAEMFELLGLKRVISRIDAFTPMPALGKFNLITAFCICFNGHKSAHVWGPPEWKFFLDDLRQNLLLPGGKAHFLLNPENDGSTVTPAMRDFLLGQGATIDRSSFWLRAPR